MSRLIDYFFNDPLRLLYFLEGTGGIWYWMSQWRDRIRLRVQFVREEPFISEDLDECSSMTCEVENLGSRPTSLEPTVGLTGYTPKREFRRYKGQIVGLGRDLQPHKPKMVTVDFSARDISFLLFRAYSFRLTRGFSKSLRVWSASQRIIGPLRFKYELVRFKWFGTYNEPQT